MAGEVTYQPNEADYVAAHRDWFVNAIRRKRFSTIASAALSAAVVMTPIGFLAGDRLPALVGAFGAGLVIGPFAILACWGLSYFLLPRRAGRLFRQHRALQKEISYGWSDAGLTYRAANGSGGTPWEDLHRWAEGKHMFLFYLTDNLFHFVPRRALTESDAEDLRNLAARLGPRALG